MTFSSTAYRPNPGTAVILSHSPYYVHFTASKPALSLSYNMKLSFVMPALALATHSLAFLNTQFAVENTFAAGLISTTLYSVSSAYALPAPKRHHQKTKFGTASTTASNATSDSVNATSIAANVTATAVNGTSAAANITDVSNSTSTTNTISASTGNGSGKHKTSKHNNKNDNNNDGTDVVIILKDKRGIEVRSDGGKAPYQRGLEQHARRWNEAVEA